MSDKSRRIEELFEAVTSLPVGSRADYLKAQCGDDAELISEVERLVRNDERASEEFLRAPPPDSRLGGLLRGLDGPDPLIGTTIASYTIKSRIAGGGMGTVYLAEQRQPRRDVALKVLHAGLWSRSAERRFEFESQAMARLRHPNIAQVYEAGVAEVNVAARAHTRPVASAPRGRRTSSCEIPISHEAPRDSHPADENAGRDSRGDGCEKGFSHQRRTGVPPVSGPTGEVSAPQVEGRPTGETPVPQGEGEAPAEPARTIRVPYFAMEYVPDAKSITEYADRHEVGVRERLGLFLQVCDAVLHGHQKGIIHRDLKPGNILVSDESEPPSVTAVAAAQSEEVPPSQKATPTESRSKEAGFAPAISRCHTGFGVASQSAIPNPQSAIVKVIDFGVAKSTDSDVAVTTQQTDARSIIGTLQYMSPEQCDGGGMGVSPVNSHDIDIRSDVYSLGVVLYELLTGHVPYDLSNLTLHSAIRQVCEQVPARPSHFSRRLRGDLETIVLKAIEKDREKRYGSAAALADDIRRHLNGEPVSARPATGWTRAARWVVRHPKAVTAMACLLVAAAATVSTVVSVWWLRWRPERVVMVECETKPPETGHVGWCARLLGVTGETLHEWPPGAQPSEPNISNAFRVDRHDAFGGGWLAVVGYQLMARCEFAGSCCAYDVAGNLDLPVWQSRIQEADVPPSMLRVGREPMSYNPGRLLGMTQADIFDDPDLPGDEIIVLFAHFPSSQFALRILSQQGDTLFQVWQDGGIGSVYWLSGPQLLVCSGADEYLKFNDPIFAARGLMACVAPIVFAIRPVRGVVLNEFMARTPDEDAPLRPEWAKYAEPPDKRDLHYEFLLDRPSTADPTRLALLTVDMCSKAEKVGAVYWLIDDRGQLMEESRREEDRVLLDQASDVPRLPKPETIRLLDLPPAKTRPPYLRRESPAPPGGGIGESLLQSDQASR